MTAVEDAKGLFVHAFTHQEDIETGRDATKIAGIEVDRIREEEEEFVDSYPQLGREVEETKRCWIQREVGHRVFKLRARCGHATLRRSHDW